jgi:hypothetical protein
MNEKFGVHGRYEVVCRSADGVILWSETITNLVTVQGCDYALDTFLGSGTGGTVYMGLISSVSYSTLATGDTAAQINGSNAWKESNTAGNTPSYSGNRKAVSFSAASAGTKTASAVVFSMTSSGVVEGAFYCVSSAATPGDTTGYLVSEAAFGSPRSVSTSDSLTINYSATLT